MKAGSFYFLNLGCPKNRVDGDHLRGGIRQLGLEESAVPERADFVIVNTCAFIEDARRESRGEILEILRQGIKKSAEVIVVGCYPAWGDIRAEIPEVKQAFAFDKYDKLLSYLAGRSGSCFEPQKMMRVSPGQPYAYVKIADGCDNRCAYCTIPSIRGPYRSTSSKAILDEVEFLTRNGVKEVILVAQDSAMFGADDGRMDLGDLCHEVARIDGIEWIRIMYAHPAHLSERLAEKIFSCAKVCRYLDLPIQHASDKILGLMNRPTSAENIRKQIKWLRNFDKELSLRTSLMVGFPGESDDDFRMLLDFAEEIRFDHVGVFGFSPEEGTTAARLGDMIDPELIRERAELLIETTSRITEEIEMARVGRIETVLIDSVSAENFSEFECRSFRQAPEIDGFYRIRRRDGLKPGDFRNIRIRGLYQGVLDE